MNDASSLSLFFFLRCWVISFTVKSCDFLLCLDVSHIAAAPLDGFSHDFIVKEVTLSFGSHPGRQPADESAVLLVLQVLPLSHNRKNI